jgi:predicted lipid-binding transport protein (Tim44 family)
LSFMGGLFNVVGAVLNALLSGSERRQGSWVSTMFMDDAPTTMSMMETPVATAQAPQQSSQQRAHDDIAALQKIDPDFSELQFLAQASATYASAISAEGAMNADLATSFATPAFVDWLRKRVSDWRSGGVRYVAQDIKPLGSTVIKLTLDGTLQAITVRFTGSGVRCTQDAATGTAIDGSLQSTSFIEFATFVRPSGTTTPKSAGAGGATHCPSCGAPTSAGASACPFCGTQLSATGGVWLLDKLSASAYT